MSYHIRAEQYNHTFTLLRYMYQWNFTEKTFKSSFSYTFIMIDLNINIEFKNFVHTIFLKTLKYVLLQLRRAINILHVKVDNTKKARRKFIHYMFYKKKKNCSALIKVKYFQIY